jgi:xanthine dehydrogenase molybdenum-binding subunit
MTTIDFVLDGRERRIEVSPRRDPARGAARAVGGHLAQGRLLRAEPVRCLSGADRRAAAQDLCDRGGVTDEPGLLALGDEDRPVADDLADPAIVGDVVAAVAAESEAIARAAAAVVVVDREPLEPTLTPEQSLAPGARRINPHHDNRLSDTRIERGDVDAAFAASAHVVSGLWQTQRIEHLFLEPEAALAVPLADGRLHLYTQGQGIFEDRRAVAAVLGEPESRIHVELVPTGGVFGGKEDMTVQAQTALLARSTGRPVRTVLDREESIRIHPERHPMRMSYRMGCDGDGRITAAEIELLGDSGAYASVGDEVLEWAAGHACGPYRVPALKIRSIAAYTDNPPCGAIRGFGVDQTGFAVEGRLDALAEKVGIDGFEMRARNIVRVGDVFSSGQILEKSVGLEQTLLAVKDDYNRAKAAGRAVGIACGVKNSGIGNGALERGRCRLVVEADGTVALHLGFTEMGQGLLTVMAQSAAEVTGLPSSLFRPRVDGRFEVGVGQTTGSRATLLGGRATIEAAKALRADLDGGATLADLVGRVYAGDVLIDDTTAPGELENGKIETHTAFGWATQVAILDETGRVARVVAAHDVGRAINPKACESQIEGAVHMGLGYALTEQLPCRDGMPVSFDLRDIGVLRAADMPEVEVILIEDPEPEGPFGAKGLGEIGLVPTAGAVAAALEAFDGIRRRRLPMIDGPAAAGLGVGLRVPEAEREDWH